MLRNSSNNTAILLIKTLKIITPATCPITRARIGSTMMPSS